MTVVTVRVSVSVRITLVVTVKRAMRVIVVPINLRMVSSTMTMIEGAHDIDRLHSNRKWALL
jgi:hypothetical protein